MKRQNKTSRSLTILVACLLLAIFLQPVSQASRSARLRDTSNGILVGDRTSQPSLASPTMPDLVSQHGITIGGAIGGVGGHFSAWGGTITLSAADAIVVSGGKCAFNVSYDMVNLGTDATSALFKNNLRIGSTDVSIQSSLSLAGGATRQIDTQAYLQPGTNTLSLTLDSENAVAESNEANNVSTVTINVNCPAATGLPDITSQKGITIGGAIGGAGGHFAAWGGNITLTAADASLVSGGNCAFNVSYDMENTGPTPTTPNFLNRLTFNGAVVAINSALSLAAGATQQINTAPYLANGNHILALKLDDDHLVTESDEANNLRQVKVKVNCH